jgi:hypothetical protein
MEKARQVAREVKEMTRREIITKVIDGQISWVAAALSAEDNLSVTAAPAVCCEERGGQEETSLSSAPQPQGLLTRWFNQKLRHIRNESHKLLPASAELHTRVQRLTGLINRLCAVRHAGNKRAERA